jgi:hypothetical protein
MKTTKPELEVPHRATHELAEVIARGFPPDAPEYRYAVRLIATPVVIAELRAQAALIRRSAKYGPSDAWMTHKLDRRADELEAGA